MEPEGFDEVADALYGLETGEFVSARNDAVRRLRSKGDRELADQVKALPRPNLSAWCVNQLVRERPQDMQSFGDLAAALRVAQATLAADDMRALAGQRRELVTSLLRSAGELAARSARQLSTGAAEEIRGTLDAALSDPEIAKTVMSGRLTTAVTYAGLGDVEVRVTHSVPNVPAEASRRTESSRTNVPAETSGPARLGSRNVPAETSHPAPTPRRPAKEAARAVAARAEASAAVDETRRDLDAARTRLGQARQRRSAAERELAEAVRDVHDSELAVRSAKSASEEAERRLRRLC